MIHKLFSAPGLAFVASDQSLDRGNDQIDPNGWQLADYQKNPVLLWGHDATRPPIGRVENLRVEAAALRGQAVLDENDAFALQLKKKIANGFLAGVSVGFKPLIVRPNKSGGFDFLKSELLEISLVSVPANSNALISKDCMNIEHLKAQRADLLDCIEKNIDSDAFNDMKQQIADLDRQLERAEAVRAMKAAAAVPIRVHPDDLPPGQASGDFQISRLIAASCGLTDAPELAVCRKLTAEQGADRGLRIPFTLAKAQTVGSAPAGGFLVPDMSQGLIDRLTAQSLVSQLPVTRLAAPPGVGSLILPRVASGTTGAWIGEGGTVSESSLTLDRIMMTPRLAGIRAAFSRMLLATSTPSIESVVVRDLAQSLSELVDTALLSGSGVGNEPKGVLSQGTPLAESSFANLWNALAATVKTLETANVDMASARWLIGPAAAQRLRTEFKADGADAVDGRFIAESGNGLMGYPVIVSTFVPAQTAVFAAWNDVIVAQWGMADLIVDQYSAAETGMIRVILYLMLDVALRHQASLVTLTLSS